MAVAPFIRPLQVSGGTFYSFTSSAQDIGKTFNSSNVKFRFSKYVLLNLPDIAVPAYNNNTIQFGAIDGALIQGLSPDQNVNLAQWLQNYMFNLEATLLSQTTYDYSNKLNVAERCWWKALKELGAIQFIPSNSTQYTGNQSTAPRFVELPEADGGSNQYQRVVQYIGDINIANNVQNNVNAYTELYLLVPTSDGNTPLVMFQTVSDTNYSPDSTLVNPNTNPLDAGIIVGRNYNDIQPAGLSIQAIYDQVAPGVPTSDFYDAGTDSYDINQRWYDPRSGNNLYYTDLVFTDPTTDKIQKTFNSSIVTYQRTRLDGITLDFNEGDYVPIANSNPNITTFAQFNSTTGAQPFEFNAVLIYYDLYDPNNPTDFATNLYGVLFLADVEQNGVDYAIPREQKYMPNPVTQLNGNSYGLKVNIKFDTSVDNVGTEPAINDYSPFSLNLFVDALNVLQQAGTILTSQQTQFVQMQNQVNSLEDQLINTASFNEIDLRLTTLEDEFAANQALFSNTDTVIGMINTVSQNLQNIIQGRTSIQVSYNIDIVKQGSGIFVDRSVPNQITIDNVVQTYNLQPSVSYSADLHTGGTIKLYQFTNYFRHDAGGLSFNLTNDIFISIDDSATPWTIGQAMRIVFVDPINPQTNSVIFNTDALNKNGSGTYGVLVGAANTVDFTPSGDTPIFEIVCVNDDYVHGNLQFVLDRIR